MSCFAGFSQIPKTAEKTQDTVNQRLISQKDTNKVVKDTLKQLAISNL